jgi:hypothetical protein
VPDGEPESTKPTGTVAVNPYLTIGVIGAGSLIALAANALLICTLLSACTASEVLMALLIAVGADVVLFLCVDGVRR